MASGTRTFEQGEKFWEAWIDGLTVFSRFGKVGMKGQTRLKKVPTDEAAEALLAKMIAEKIEQGFVEGGEAAASSDVETNALSPPASSRDAAPDSIQVNRRIANMGEDENAHLVLSDWLEEQNHPLGELIALEHANKPTGEFLAKHAAVILGSESLWPGSSITWRRGLVHEATLATPVDPDSLYRTVRDFLNAPATQRLERLIVQPVPDTFRTVRDYDNCEVNFVDPWPDLAALASLLPKTLKHFGFGGLNAPPESAYVHVPNLANVSNAFAKVRSLELTGHFTTTIGVLDHAKLRELTVRFAETEPWSLAMINEWKLPALERLTIWIGGTANCDLDDVHQAEERDYDGDDGESDEDFEPYPETHPASDLADMEVYGIGSTFGGADLRDIFRKFPSTLTHLGIQGALMTVQMYESIVTNATAVLKNLKSLDLSRGYMDDDESRVLIDAKESLNKLTSIDVSRNCLTPAGAKALLAALPNIVIGEQRTAKKLSPSEFGPAWHRDDERDRFFMRYVAGKE